jgi:hypothetical protein
MRRNRYCGYLEQTNCGYLVAFDLQWKIIESRRVDANLGAAAALAAFVKEFEANGWSAESEGSYGFVFVNRCGERMLLEVTPRDPHDTTLQSFNPFRGK